MLFCLFSVWQEESAFKLKAASVKTGNAAFARLLRSGGLSTAPPGAHKCKLFYFVLRPISRLIVKFVDKIDYFSRFSFQSEKYLLHLHLKIENSSKN